MIHPKLESVTTVDCVFDWRLPPQWVLATSFGAEKSRQKFKGTWNSVQNAVFAAGDFRLHRSQMGKGTLIVAVRGEWAHSDQEIASQLAKIILLERKFWRDDDFPYYLVMLVPVESSSSGGSGFTNAFDLYVPSKTSLLSSSNLSLVAHEVFHTWNPYKLGRMLSPSQSIYWFTEGFTTHYQDRLLWRAGLMTIFDR